MKKKKSKGNHPRGVKIYYQRCKGVSTSKVEREVLDYGLGFGVVLEVAGRELPVAMFNLSSGVKTLG